MILKDFFQHPPKKKLLRGKGNFALYQKRNKEKTYYKSLPPLNPVVCWGQAKKICQAISIEKT